MREWSHHLPSCTASRRTRRRIPCRMLVPFLLFWSLGSLVLGGEVSRLPLARFASAIVRPSHAVAAAQGQLARVAADQRVRLVATGILGGKPAATAKHIARKPARTRARSSARIALRTGRATTWTTRGSAGMPWGYDEASASGWMPSMWPSWHMSGMWDSHGPWTQRAQWGQRWQWAGRPAWSMWGASGDGRAGWDG